MQSNAELRGDAHIQVEIISDFWNHHSGCYLFILTCKMLNNYGLEISLDFISKLKSCACRKILKNQFFFAFPCRTPRRDPYLSRNHLWLLELPVRLLLILLACLILNKYDLEISLNFISKLESRKMLKNQLFLQSHAELRDETHIWVKIIYDNSISSLFIYSRLFNFK